MTSYGATIIVRHVNFMPTLKVLGQVYHQINKLLPLSEEDPQFFQIYSIDNVEEEIDRPRAFSLATCWKIIAELRALFHELNCLVRVSK
ncbi:hypothetical protein NPIL_513341 [Nephila pilipes]|uniref:Uncharacterized protein n=1 Tax=Nephila pilipes TaxID=299642 RepID=A0A8X6QZ08_NEPPI|nr:hypothetical protein NPIL_513341 [Nephila pilipes]